MPEASVPAITYLTARELADRIKYKPTVINNMLKDAVLLEGIHYCVFRPNVTTDFGIVSSHFGHRDRAGISAHRDRPFRHRDRPFRRS